MTRKALLPLVATAALTGSAGHILAGTGTTGAQDGGAGTDETAADLTRMAARFAPVDLVVDLSGLPPSAREALGHLVEAARIMDGIFLGQVSAANPTRLVQLASDQSPLGRARLHYFLINKGPWSRLDDDQPFLPGVGAKPDGAGFYPADATRDEVERWIASLPASERGAATGFFTIIRRAPDESFQLVPYSMAYQGQLQAAAEHLRDAAKATGEPSLRRYLETRAKAFSSNDYYESDVAWMEIDASIEPVIGPYEVYEDEWFNYKAAFEAFVTVRDEAESKKLATLGARLQSLEDRLPIEPRYRNPKLGALAPIRVVDVIFTAGDANRGVQTAAFNLPNDERVIREKGSKRVMLKNVQQAKFTKVLAPIAKVVLSAADQPRVAFDAFFTHILMHELMHGLGPHDITVDGRTTTVRQELKELYSTIEEAKADVSGLWALETLIADEVLPGELAQTMYTTYLASMFRSIRFGVSEAHGRGVAIQLNRFLDAGAVTLAADGRFVIDDPKIKEAVRSLTADILTLQAEGSYAKAKALTVEYGVVRPDVQKALDKLGDVPVDIEPRFVTAQELAASRR
ncbi:MAG: dipeptidyl-peptidase 3 family protein [Vicinamibacteraceae bacterium]